MNRGEALGFGFIGAIASITLYYIILYFFVFFNLLVIAKQVGYDLYPTETEVWWFLVGWGFIIGLRVITKAYKWARRDYCNNCGKELKK